MTVLSSIVATSLSAGSSTPQPTSLSIVDGRVQSLGTPDGVSDTNSTSHLTYPNGLILPGLTDAHIHFTSWVQWQNYCDLSTCNTTEDVISTLKKVSSESPDAKVIVGRQWVPAFDVHDTTLRRGRLDDIRCDVPVMVFGKDLHSCWLSTKAMEAVGYNVDTTVRAEGDNADPDVIVDSQGLATGIVQETGVYKAIDYLDQFPRLTADSIRRAEAHCFERGITHLVSFEDKTGMTELGKFISDMKLNISYFLHERFVPELKDGSMVPIQVAGHLQWRGVKAFMDGSMGSGTAWMNEPYIHAPTSTGRGMKTEAELSSLVKEVYELGCCIAVHAIGDRAVDVTSRVLLVREPERTSQAFQSQIEHFQLTTQATLDSLVNGPIILSMQPCHMLFDDLSARDKWGEARMQWAFPVAQLLRQGCTVKFGSDAPVEPCEPLRNLVACERLWNENARPTRVEAIACSTWSGQAHIEQGAPATLTVWPHDVLHVTGEQDILALKPLLTVIEGQVVYKREQ